MNLVSVPSSVNMWASSTNIFQQSRRVSTSQWSKHFIFPQSFLKILFQLTPATTFWPLTRLLLVIHQFATFFMMEQSESSRKELRITSPPMKKRTTNASEEREKVSPVNSSSNVAPGYSENFQNKKISALINTRLTEFRSEMITVVNKNGDQPVSLWDRDFIMKILRQITYQKEKKLN